MPRDDVTAEMQRRAREAVAMAQTVYAENLDFTESSVDAVERILESLGGDSELSDDDRGRVAWAFGPYLGELVRRRFRNVRWWRQHPEHDQAGPYVEVDNIQIFPVLWCYKQLHNGLVDRVAAKYRAFQEALAHGPDDSPREHRKSGGRRGKK